MLTASVETTDHLNPVARLALLIMSRAVTEGSLTNLQDAVVSDQAVAAIEKVWSEMVRDGAAYVDLMGLDVGLDYPAAFLEGVHCFDYGGRIVYWADGCGAASIDYEYENSDHEAYARILSVATADSPQELLERAHTEDLELARVSHSRQVDRINAARNAFQRVIDASGPVPSPGPAPG